jgi:hypothetical protein
VVSFVKNATRHRLREKPSLQRMPTIRIAKDATMKPKRPTSPQVQLGVLRATGKPSNNLEFFPCLLAGKSKMEKG